MWSPFWLKAPTSATQKECFAPLHSQWRPRRHLRAARMGGGALCRPTDPALATLMTGQQEWPGVV